jgi:hypothetical protein
MVRSSFGDFPLLAASGHLRYPKQTGSISNTTQEFFTPVPSILNPTSILQIICSAPSLAPTITVAMPIIGSKIVVS